MPAPSTPFEIEPDYCVGQGPQSLWEECPWKGDVVEILLTAWSRHWGQCESQVC